MNISSLFKTFWRELHTRPATISIEMGRVAIGIAWGYLIFWKKTFIDGVAFYESHIPENYFPKGVLAIFLESTPSIELINLFILLHKIFLVLMILGLFSRISSILTFISALILYSLLESVSPYWSHGFNLVLLTHMAFLIAPIGRYFSLDAFFLKKMYPGRELKPSPVLFILLPQFSVSGMFFVSFCWKFFIRHQQFSPNWALSDSFRNLLIVRYQWSGYEIPNHVEWIINNEFAYKFFASGNLIFQSFSMLAIFFIKKPGWRLFFGLFFLAEEIGLQWLIQLYDTQWYFLFVFFVDWDYFIAKIRNVKPQVLEYMITLKYKFYHVFGALFAFIYLFVGLGFTILIFGKTPMALNIYPFSNFSMYSYIASNDSELPYHHIGCYYILKDKDGNQLLTDTLINDIRKRYYGAFSYNDSLVIRQNLNELKTIFLKGEFTATHKIEMYRCLFLLKEGNQSCYLQSSHRGLMAEMENDSLKHLITETFEKLDSEFNYRLGINLFANDSIEIRNVTLIKSMDGQRYQFFESKVDKLNIFIKTDQMPDQVLHVSADLLDLKSGDVFPFLSNKYHFK